MALVIYKFMKAYAVVSGELQKLRLYVAPDDNTPLPDPMKEVKGTVIGGLKYAMKKVNEL